MTKFKPAAGEFLSGLTTANPRVFLTSLLVATLLLACIELGLSRGWLWRLDAGWLISTPYDDWTHAMWAVNQLNENSNAIPIFLVGGSGSREAVISNESVERALTEKSSQHFRFLNLGTRNQTFFETVVLIENLPDTKKGLIVFGLTPHFFTDGVEAAYTAVRGTRFPLYSHTLVQALESMGLLHLDVLPINVLRYRAMFSNYLNKRIAGRNFFKRLTYRYHLYEGRSPLRSAALEKNFRFIESEMEAYPTHAVLNFQMLELAIRLAKAKGYEVFLFDLPRNPVGEERLYGDILESYRKNLKTLTAATQSTHFDLHSQFRFPQSYFYDHLHQTDEARVIFQEKFLELVLSQLERS